MVKFRGCYGPIYIKASNVSAVEAGGWKYVDESGEHQEGTNVWCINTGYLSVAMPLDEVAKLLELENNG